MQAQLDSKITFNFVDVEIPAVIKFISKITGYNFIFDERIKGKVTIIAPTKLSIDESFTLFTSVLGPKGFTLIPAEKKLTKLFHLHSQNRPEKSQLVKKSLSMKVI